MPVIQHPEVGPPEEHDVHLRTVNGVVHPTPTLLNSQLTPLYLQQDLFDHESVIEQQHESWWRGEATLAIN